MLINLSFIILLLVLSPCSLLVKAQHQTNSLILDTCKKTPNYALCVSTLKSNPRSSTADVAGLGFILVGAVKAKSTAGLKTITELSRANPVLKKRLSQCMEDYKMILSAFVPEAEQAIGGDPKFAEDGMNGIADVTAQCVKSLQGVRAPLPSTNKLVHDLSLVTVSIIRTML